MCRIAMLGAALLLSVALLGSAAQAADPACQVVIGSCHRPPLSTPAGTGIVDRLTIEAFRRVGVAACIEQLPCERSLRNADAGTSDGDLMRIPSVIAERFPNLVAIPEVLYALPISGFTSRSGRQPKSIEDLAPLRVGHILGWKILEDRLGPGTLRVRGVEELFPLLTENKADVVIYERITGLHMINELGLKGIHEIEPPFLITPQSLVLHRRHQALVEPLAVALRSMKADGTYAAAFRAAGYAAPARK
jgi:polar amino acid transport system substrate-binding protein